MYRKVLVILVLVTLATALTRKTKGQSEISEAQARQFEQLLAVEDPVSFSQSATAFWKLRGDWSAERQSAVREALGDRAKQFLLGANELPSMERDTLQLLQGLAIGSLSMAEKDELTRRIEARFPASETATFGQMQSRIALVGGMTTDPAARRQQTRELVEQWLEQQDPSAMTQSQLNACFRYLCPAIEGQDGFRVTWAGYVTPVRSGPHMFSIPPWDVNSQQVEDSELVRNQLKVTVRVNNQVVVDAKPDAWNFEGKPIDLTAGEKVPLHIELTYSYTPNDHHRTCPAILYWQAPGLTKNVVPSTALSVEEDGSSGLQAEYVWKEPNSDKETVVHTVDPNIDFVWVDALTIGPRGQAEGRLAAELIARWSQAGGDFIQDVARLPQIVVLLTSDQLHECLHSVIENPAQLDDISRSRMEHFFYATRAGGGEAAVDLLGTWMTRQQYFAPEFAASVEEYFDLNHEFNHRLAQFIAAENRPAMEQLERE